MLQRLGNHVHQHGRGLICRLSILDMRNHGADFIFITPGLDLLEPMDPIAKPRLSRQKSFVADGQILSDHLPEGTDGAALEIAYLTPFKLVDKPHRLGSKQAQRVQHIFLVDRT